MSPSFLDRFKPCFPFKPVAIISLLLATLISMSCGGASNGASSSQLIISPNSLNLASGARQQFTATVLNTSNPAVLWKVSAGTISNDGLFIAPTVASNTTVVVSAASVEDLNKTASATLMIEPSGSLRITTTALPAGVVDTPYDSTFSASGGTPPYRWSVQGSLPQGLSLTAASGSVAGIPTITGSFSIQAVVTDAHSTSANQAVNLVLTRGNSKSGYDGPAELPRVYIQSALADTPASGTVISVPPSGNLQSALDKASCGDTVKLQAGATYSGVFTLPAKPCDDNHWIVIRTSAPDSALPQEGTRVTPCYAGVSSLPGRPPLNCSSTANVLARLMMNAAPASGPIVFASGANHYRLLGLEITRQPNTPIVYNLASVQLDGTIDNVVFDRVWMHGSAQDETTRGIELGGSTYVSVVDSYFTDFHCNSNTGSCTDAQAIAGGLGNHPMGPYKIVNNFLEAAAENILFGGGAATLNPADIEIRHNHMFKPLTWMKGQPGYVGGKEGSPFVVKNLFELKNAQRVLLDGNLMENTWGGLSQVGFAILLTPRNQPNGSGGNLCPACQVTDVTIRNTMIRHVAAGMQIANPLDGVGKPLAGERYSIHDVIIDDIDGLKYNGPSEFAQVSVGAGVPIVQDLSIDHVTAFPSSTLFIIGDQTTNTPKMHNFAFTNSIVNAGQYPVWSTGSGGPANCAVSDTPLLTFNACFSLYTFAGNAIIAPSQAFPSSKWPHGNVFPASAATVHFVNYNSGNGGDYHLQFSSPYKHAGTDGKDLGADVDAVLATTQGVE
jgi:Putative Ig domain